MNKFTQLRHELQPPDSVDLSLSGGSDHTCDHFVAKYEQLFFGAEKWSRSSLKCYVVQPVLGRACTIVYVMENIGWTIETVYHANYSVFENRSCLNCCISFEVYDLETYSSQLHQKQ